MLTERIVIREKTWKYWLFGGPVLAPGADRFWRMRGYTRRRRAAVYWSLLLAVVTAVVLVWNSELFVDVAALKANSKLPWLFWMLVPAVTMYLALRVILLPMYLYNAHFARRVRRAQGRLCWECGCDVGAQSDGVCACGEPWSSGALRQFWTACALLPATQREVREARFAVDSAPGKTKTKADRGVRLPRFISPLPRDQMSAWQERPLTQGWIKSSMRLSAALSMVVFVGLVFATLLLSRALTGGSVSPFFGGVIGLGLVAVASQVAIMRWSLSRTVRRARERVRDADGLICTDCGFVLRGLDESDRCPECGIEFRADELRGFFRASGVLTESESRVVPE